MKVLVVVSLPFLIKKTNISHDLNLDLKQKINYLLLQLAVICAMASAGKHFIFKNVSTCPKIYFIVTHCLLN